MDKLSTRKTGVRGVKRVTVKRSGKTYVYYRHRRTGRNILGDPTSLQFRRELNALDNDLTGVSSAPPLPMSIYFISNGGGAVKIGISQDVTARLAGLQTAWPTALTLLGTIPGSPAEEREIHKRFQHIHMRGEWFRLTDEILQMISGNSG